MNVQFFDDAIEMFIRTLETPTIAKTLRTIDLLEQFGHELGLPHSRSLGGGLFELRMRGRQDVRIFYTFHRDNAILLHGCVKKSQKMPIKELLISRTKLRSLDNV